MSPAPGPPVRKESPALEAIFARLSLNSLEKVNLYFYDFALAFDTVEYHPVLLDNLDKTKPSCAGI